MVKKSKKRAAKRSVQSREAKISIKPLGDRVLVLPEAEEAGRETSSGIFIPETIEKEKPQKGRVVAVGEGRRNDAGELIPVSVKVGSRVIFSKYGFDEVKIGDKEYYLISESNILAVIK